MPNIARLSRQVVTEAKQHLQLYLKHRQELIDYAIPIVGGRAQAEDVVQDAWLRFDQHQHSDIKQPVGYLYRIVRNLALDLTRRIATEQPAPDSDQLLAALPAQTQSVEATVCDQDSLQAIDRALDELPERTRLAFEMHRLGGYRLQEIADHLGISVGLAHQLVHQALSHCAKRLNMA